MKIFGVRNDEVRKEPQTPWSSGFLQPFASSDDQINTFVADWEVTYGYGFTEPFGFNLRVLFILSLNRFVKIDAAKGCLFFYTYYFKICKYL